MLLITESKIAPITETEILLPATEATILSTIELKGMQLATDSRILLPTEARILPPTEATTLSILESKSTLSVIESRIAPPTTETRATLTIETTTVLTDVLSNAAIKDVFPAVITIIEA